MKKILNFILGGALVLMGLFVASPALAAGSDAPTPYKVTSTGVFLPDGDTFKAHGHINIRIGTSEGSEIRQSNMHFDPNNNHPGGAYIGESFFPVDLKVGECIIWVQISHYNEHFGEGGQAPVCNEPSEPVIPEKPESITGDEQRTSDPVCVEPLDGTTTSTLETVVWTQDHIWDEESFEWLSQKRVYGDWEVAEVYISENDECAPAVVEPEPEVPATPTPVVPESPTEPVKTVQTDKVETLATTGATGANWLTYGAAGALILAGGVVWLVRKFA